MAAPLPVLTLGFENFWPMFDPTDSWFVDVLSRHFDVRVEADPSVHVDLLVYSVFGANSVNRSGTKRVFYTGENVPPHLNHADLSISFERMEHPRHVRIPIYIMYTDWFEKRSHPDRIGREVYTRAGRTFLPGQRDAVMVMSSRAVGFRLELLPVLFRELGTSRVVSLGGFMHTAGVPMVSPGDKLRNVRGYKLNLAIENSQHPGYTTEKILEAYAGNAIPVYHGDPTVALDFNPASFLDVSAMSAVEAARAIGALLADPERMDRMLAEPPMRAEPDIESMMRPLVGVAYDAISEKMVTIVEFPMAAGMRIAMYILFKTKDRVWYQDTYAAQLQLSLRSMVETCETALPSLLFVCDAESRRAIEAMPEVAGLNCIYCDVDSASMPMIGSMCSRFRFFEIARDGVPADCRVLYLDTDILFFRDVNLLFDRIVDDGVVYVKGEDRFDPARAHNFFCLRDEPPLPGVPYFNSGHFGFACGPKSRAMFQEMVACVPDLCGRSLFLDQPVMNSFFRNNHPGALDYDAFRDVVGMDTCEPYTTEHVIMHYICGRKDERMRAILESGAPRSSEVAPPEDPWARAGGAALAPSPDDDRAVRDTLFHACILLQSAPERHHHVYRRIRPALDPHALAVIPAVNGRAEEELRSTCTAFYGRLPVLDNLYRRCAAAAKLSHAKALYAFLESDSAHGVIIEDDADIRPGFNARLRECVDALPADYELLYAYVPAWFMEPRSGLATMGPLTPAYETYTISTYVVSRRGARRLLGILRAERIDDPIDVMYADMVKAGTLRAHCATARFVENLGQPVQGSREGMPSNIWNDRF